MKNNIRVIKYVESKDPLTVSLTMKEQVKLYLEHKKPDVFGFMGDLTEKGRLRHYQRLLTLLSRELKTNLEHFTENSPRLQYLNKFQEKRDFYGEGIRYYKFSKK